MPGAVGCPKTVLRFTRGTFFRDGHGEKKGMKHAKTGSQGFLEW